MRIGLFSDIHGNLSALNAILADMATVRMDVIAFLGDAVSFGPFPVECLRRICNIPRVVLIRGNHESVMMAPEFPREALTRTIPVGRHEVVENQQRTYSCLGGQERELIAQFRHQVTLNAEGSSVSMVHASLESDAQSVNSMSGDEEYGRALGEYALCAFGHIHRQLVRRVGGSVYLNPGGAGAPLDGKPGAPYAIAEIDGKAVSADLRRLPYDPTPELTRLYDERWPFRDTLAGILKEGIDPYYETLRKARRAAKP